MKFLARLINEGSVTVVFDDGLSHVITDSHPNYDSIRDAAKDDDADTALNLINVAQHVETFTQGKVTVVDGEILYDGDVMHNSLTDRMLNAMGEGVDITFLVNFLENVMLNPSHRSVTELYGFLDACNLPITPDGYILAYKMVRSDYKDQYTGKMDNSPGKVVEMPRNMVDDDKDRTCSTGLHFCSQAYLNSYSGGQTTVVLKIHPRDVVSIPSDYDNAKGRACRYEVVADISKLEVTSNDGDIGAFGGKSVVDVADINASNKTGKVVTENAAMKYFGLGNAQDPESALRKRLDRGTSCERVDQGNGKFKVRLLK